MAIYLGEVTLKNEYVNYEPYYLYEDERFKFLSKAERRELLPESEFTNINLSAPAGSTLRDVFSNKQFYFFEYDLSDLEPNINAFGERNRTGYKITVTPDVLEKRFHNAAWRNLYRLIDTCDINGDFKTGQIIFIADDAYYVEPDSQVYIRMDSDESMVAGPFIVEERKNDGRLYIKANEPSRKFVLPIRRFRSNIDNYTEDFSGYSNEQTFVRIDGDSKAGFLDTASEEELLKNFRDYVNLDSVSGGKLDLADGEKIIRSYSNSLFAGANVPREVLSKRYERLMEIFTAEKDKVSIFNKIGEGISDILLKYKDEDFFSEVISRIANDPHFMSQVQHIAIINEKISERQAELEELVKHVEELEAHRAEVEKHLDIDAEARFANLLSQRKHELASVEDKLKSIKERLQLAQNIDEQTRQLNDVTTRLRQKEFREGQLDLQIEKIENRLNKILSEASERAVGFTFDAMLSNRLVKSAESWDRYETELDYRACAAHLASFDKEVFTQRELMDYLYKRVSRYRPNYDRNTIMNIFICLTQGFLTVFSGEPGTGKTSICNIVGNVLGLNLPCTNFKVGSGRVDLTRYIPVSVEKGWTSKRDFVGYYNPLTKRFDSSNKRVFDALNILHSEDGNGIMPCLILLDEANLSPMEYYWADFMNICDGLPNGVSQGSTINLGENYCFRVPEYLRFVATINNDHTTEALSPRLIDRAWIIRLPQNENCREAARMEFSNVRAIPWSALKMTFMPEGKPVPMTNTIEEIYREIILCLKGMRIKISPRIDIAIRKYWSVAQRVFDNNEEYGIDASVVALDYAVAQRILPHISVNGDNAKQLLRNLAKFCADQNMHICSDILEDIITRGEQTVNYFRYFA